MISWSAALPLLSFLLFYTVSFDLCRHCQIMFNLDRVHIILDEMIQNGHVVETNRNRVLAPLSALDKLADG